MQLSRKRGWNANLIVVMEKQQGVLEMGEKPNAGNVYISNIARIGGRRTDHWSSQLTAYFLHSDL